jgi:hypothetical protein
MAKRIRASVILGAAASVGLLGVSSAMGASIGVNFTGLTGATDALAGPGGQPDDVRSLAPTVSAGVVPSIAWNNTPENTASGNLAALLADNAGVAVPTAASVTWASNGTWTAHNTPVGADGNQILTNGYIDDTAPTPDPQIGNAVTLNNLPFIGPYDIYVYFGSDGNDRTGTITTSNSATVYNVATNTNPFDGTFTLATPADDGNADNGEYALFSGVTGNSVTITATRGSNNIGVHGVQLVGPITEPTGLGLLAVGGLGFLARRRRRA